MFGKLFKTVTESTTHALRYLRTRGTNAVNGLKSFIWDEEVQEEEVQVEEQFFDTEDQREPQDNRQVPPPQDDEFHDAEEFGVDGNGVNIQEGVHALDASIRKFEVTVVF